MSVSKTPNPTLTETPVKRRLVGSQVFLRLTHWEDSESKGGYWTPQDYRLTRPRDPSTEPVTTGMRRRRNLWNPLSHRDGTSSDRGTPVSILPFEPELHEALSPSDEQGGRPGTGKGDNAVWSLVGGAGSKGVGGPESYAEDTKPGPKEECV